MRYNILEKIKNYPLRSTLGDAVKKIKSRPGRPILLGSTVLSAVLQFFPGLVSRPFDDYMKTQGAPADLSAHFHAASTHVYDSWNPLTPFHRAGRSVVASLQNAYHSNTPVKDLCFTLLTSPINYASSFVSPTIREIFTPLNAYCIRGDTPLENRAVFINPPRIASAKAYVEEFLPSDILKDDHSFTSAGDPEKLRQKIFEFIMLHEARHGDQDSKTKGSTNESDADLYAMRVLEARQTDTEAVEEAGLLVRHTRVLQAVLSEDESHVTGFALGRGETTILKGCDDVSASARLHRILNQLYKINELAVKKMSEKRALMHLALAVDKANAFAHDAELQKTFSAFIEAISYMDKATGNGLIDNAFDLSKIDVACLNKNFKPVPDKLEVPPASRIAAKAPAPGR